MNKQENLKFCTAALTIVDSLELNNLRTSFHFASDSSPYIFVTDKHLKAGEMVYFWDTDSFQYNAEKFRDFMVSLKTDDIKSFKYQELAA